MLCNIIVYQESRNVSRVLRDMERVLNETDDCTICDTNPVDNHWQAGGSWTDKERTVIAGRQCRLGTPANPSPRSSFHSLSRPSCHVSLASKPISYLHLRFLTFVISTRFLLNLQNTFTNVCLFIPFHLMISKLLFPDL